MPLRTALVLAFFALLARATGQPCFRVARQEDAAPLPGCVALNPYRTVLGTSDAQGLLCLRQHADTVLLEAGGRTALRIPLARALAEGLVLLAPATTELEPLTVEPWPTPRDRLALAATSTPDSALLHSNERSSLRSALLWAPGVQWDQRGLGGSLRVGIRGSLLRSPFGVRGLKAYWGPFPITLADGSTPLELLDPALVGGIDVVRSVGSPVFGAAPAGLLLARPALPQGRGAGLDAELIGGPYGYYRMALSTGTATATKQLATGLVKQGNDGYREQEWSSREQAWMAGRWRGKGGETLALITLQRASWALPGSVDSLTAYTAPRAARPYSQLVNAQVDKTQLLAGIFNELHLGHGLRLRNGIHAQVIDKRNPYGTSAANNGYKDEDIGAFGARLALHGEHRMRRYDLAWDAGLEALAERDELLEHAYPEGVMGDVRTDASTRVGHLTPFAAVQVRDRRITMHASLGGERYQVRHDDHLRDTSQQTVRNAGLLPGLGLGYAVNDHLQVHVRHGNASSRPTVWELLGSNGVFNPELAGERVAEWELGLDLGADSGAVRASAVGYARTIDGLIEAVAIDGTDQVTYRNTGTARQNGLELSATGTARSAGGTLVSGVVALALQDHRWHRDGAAGPVPAPGVPDLTFGALGRVGLRKGTTLEAGWRAVGPVAADAAGTAEVPGYALVHLRATQRFRLRAGAQLGIFLHADNLFDERYTGFVQVNDPGGRYYNPAPGRSLFVGAAFTWRERTGP